MDIHQVICAVTIAKHGSLSKAADALYLSQPALSQRVKKLENELGYPLFRRSPQGISLTAAGQRFCRGAQPLMEAWEQFQAQVAVEKPSVKRCLRIGIGPRVYSNGLFDQIVHFFDMHPDIEVTFVTEAGKDYLPAIIGGSLDLALDRLPPEELLSDREPLFSMDLICERQCILMSLEDPRSAWKEIHFSDLQGCAMISALEDSSEDRTLKAIFQRHGIQQGHLYRADNIDTIMSMVRHGRGLVIGPESFVDYYGVAGVPLVPEIDVSLKFICKKSHSEKAEMVLFRKYLEQLCMEKAARGTPR
ncbi:LysR family transcriptional regulator [Dysosmobacter sp.]|uniref:LysR family transcriptional regulator n=1 Tax=Dysosmobacter sp. TaxID=2591382 RepID=UPI002A8EDBDA|nr:LysR family transcriptional regulator [Dysosmobacter sp.]MDY3984358.1 LysR family transcriptional regulator [Dysosmobacter sp.]